VTLTYLVIPSASEGSHYPIPELSKTKILNLGVFRSKQELIKRNSRRYAKRQFTWWSNDMEIKWFNPDQLPDLIKYIEMVIAY
jgi:tRNA A37 N6-isopentenylltransferase MiaA